MSVHIEGKGDLAMSQIDLADKTLGEVHAYIGAASPRVNEAFNVVAQRINSARNLGMTIEREITDVLDDNRVYPQGRYEQAVKVVEKSQAVLDGMKQAQAAAVMATKLLEEDAMPRFEGDRDEQRAVEREIDSIMARSTDHAATLSRLATNPRYAALVASPFGRSQLYERGLSDRDVENAYALVRSEARLWAAEHGTDAQRQAAARVELGEKMQAAVFAAASGARTKLEPHADRVKRLGLQLAEEDARRIRDAGRAR